MNCNNFFYFTLCGFIIYLKVVFLQETDQINVGTVLFSPSDNLRKCWSNEQLALLRSRMIYEDALPKTDTICMKDEIALTALINYFRMAVSKVKSMTYGKTKEINLMALTDAIGGYIRTIVLPLAKEAFYTGKINYESTQNLVDLYEEIKDFLRTDGRNWGPPRIPKPSKETGCPLLPDLVAEGTTSADPCSGLIFSCSQNGEVNVPLPFFDTKIRPNAIAVPFKIHPLENLDDLSAAFILVKYYVTVMKCLTAKKANKYSVERFNKEFEEFINNVVSPFLHEEKVYAAFGSIHRLKNTINKVLMGEIPQQIISPVEGNNSDIEFQQKSSKILLICIAGVAILWLIITIIYCCIKSQRKSKHYEDPRSGRRSSKVDSKISVLEQNDKKHRHSVKGLKNKSGKTVMCGKDGKPVVIKSHCDKCQKPNCSCKSKKDSSKLSSRSKSQSDNTSQKKSSSPKRTSYFKSKCEQCPKCKRNTCGHSSSSTSKHSKQSKLNFMINMASLFQKDATKFAKSAPISGQNELILSEEIKNTSSTCSTPVLDDKPYVFGYDFETSTSESSSLEESSMDSSPRHVVKFKN